MAKTSSIEKNKRAPKLVKQYAGKRARFKAIANDESLDDGGALRGAPQAGRAAAQLGADPRPQPLRAHRPPARLLSQVEDVAYRAARTRLARA